MIFKKKVYPTKQNNSQVIIIFSHWKSKSFLFLPLIRSLSKKYTVILYTYPRKILSSNSDLTKKYFKFISNDAKKSIKSFKKVNVIGLSIGSYLAFYFAKSNKINKLLFITCSSDFSEFIWFGNKTQKIKQELVFRFNLKKFKKLNLTLSPIYNIKKINCNVVAIFSINDKTIPFYLSKDLIDNLPKNTKIIKHEFLSHNAVILKYLFSPLKILRILDG